MATIPTAQPQSIATGGFSAQGTQPMRNATGEQLQQFGEGAQRAALGAYEVGLQAQQDYDTARTVELTNKLTAAARGEVAKYLRLTGRDAQDQRKSVLDALDKHLRSIEKGIENPVQESAFGPRAGQLMTSLVAMVDEHEAEQTKSYKLAELDTAAKEANRQFLFFQRPGFEDEASAEMDKALAAVAEASRMQGIPDGSPIMQQRLLQTRSALHGSAMKQLAEAGDTAGLKAYYQSLDWQADLTAEAKQTVDKVLAEMQQKDDATTAAIALDPLPYADRVKKLDEQLKAGVLNAETYNRAIGVVEDREARAHRVAAAGRQQLITQMTQILDQDRQTAGTGGMRSLEEVLPATVLQQLKDQGLYGVAEQYAQRGRRATTPEGVAMIADLRRDSAQLRGVPWDVVFDGSWMVLDEQDTDRVAAMWAEVNQQPKPTQGGRGGRGGLDGLGMQGGDFWSTQLDRVAGSLGPKPDQAAIDRRKMIEMRLDADLRRIVAAKPNEDPRDLLKDYVDQLLVRQVQDSSGAVVAEYVAAEGELTVQVPDGQGNTVPVSYTELRKPGVTERLIGVLEKQREAALQMGRQDEAERLAQVIASRSEFDLATLYGNLLVQDRQRGAVDAMKTLAQQAKTNEEAQRAEEVAISEAWSFYRGQSPSSYNHPWWESFRKWQFTGSEAARRENAKKWPNDPRFNFYQWHGIKDPAAERAPLSFVDRLILDAAEVSSAYGGNLLKAEQIRDARRKMIDQSKPK